MRNPLTPVDICPGCGCRTYWIKVTTASGPGDPSSSLASGDLAGRCSTRVCTDQKGLAWGFGGLITDKDWVSPFWLKEVFKEPQVGGDVAI